MTRATAHPNASQQSIRRGFSLVELMIAMAIFAIGSIAVASIFPVAILLQKATVADMRTSHFAASTRAMVEARGFKESVVSADVTQAALVTPVPTLINPTVPTSHWHLADRSYNAVLPFTSRKVFWIPLFFAVDPTAAIEARGYRAYLFVVKAAANATYAKPGGVVNWANPDDPAATDTTYPAVPGVRRLSVTVAADPDKPALINRFSFANNPRLIRAGERILDEKGRIWIVKASGNTYVAVDEIPEAAGTTMAIWFAHPDDDNTYSSYVDLIEILYTTDNRLIRP